MLVKHAMQTRGAANVKRQIFPPTQTGRYEIGSVD